MGEHDRRRQTRHHCRRTINPDQARVLQLLRNVVMATVRETTYKPIDTAIFARAPFTLVGGRTRMESIFGRE